MSLDDINHHLRSTKSRANFDAWVSTNIQELTDFFYSLSKDDLRQLKFDTEFYFGVFTRSAVFIEFQRKEYHSKPFDAFLNLLAVVAERLAMHFGLTGTIEHLLRYLPESSVKYRLSALALCQNIDDIKTDYLKLFPEILSLLQKASVLELENHNLRLIDFLIYYYQKAEKKLSEKKYQKELDALKSEFTNADTKSRFRFLGHVSVQELIAGRYPHELEIENTEETIIYPSPIVENHFKYNINQQVLSHKKTIGISVLMGYDKEKILNDVLERGKTKFDESFNGLEPSDKVLLYCYFNMKKHFFTSLVVFKKMWKTLHQIFKSKSYSPVLIDLGCGPLTSGMALAELYRNETDEPLCLNYIGVDISAAMIMKAMEFSESDLFHEDSVFEFYKSWNEIPAETLKKLAGKNNPFFINASYLFANLTKSVTDDLATFVRQLVSDYKNVHFIFQNPDRVDRNENWERFKGQINFEIVNKEKKVEHVVYNTSRKALRPPGEEDVYYEILTLKS